MSPDSHSPEPRWSHEPLEETLDGARRLSVAVADRMMRGGWEALARVAGVPSRRWRQHHPIAPDGRIVALVDGRPAFDVAAWERFVSLMPGAVALPSRTAASFGVPRAAVWPPGRPPLRIVDLLRSRRARARLRRAERTLDADHARHAAAVERAVTAALAPGEDGSPLAALPTYALAARLELLVDATAGWEHPAVVDLAGATAVRQLLLLLEAGGLGPDEAFMQAAELQAGGGVPSLSHLAELAAVDDLPTGERPAATAAWLDGASGWHASRDLLLEATPLREDLDAARRIASRTRTVADVAAMVATSPSAELADAVTRSRRLVAMRERVARDRARHVAGLRALTWSLARALRANGTLDAVDDAFDLELVDLLRAARGGAVSASSAAEPAESAPDSTRTTDGLTPALPRELRGLPASRGVATGHVVVLDDPSLDADVDGAVLVCRVTDPAWLPLVLRCSALVTERGGPLSHAAIVARELGVPAVVGATGVLAAAARAATAMVDGGTGVVVLNPTS